MLDPYYLVPFGSSINRAWCEPHPNSPLGPVWAHTVNTSYYHSQLGVDVPEWTQPTTWNVGGVLTRFDNVAMSIWVLLQMSSLENWSGIMFQAMQVWGKCGEVWAR